MISYHFLWPSYCILWPFMAFYGLLWQNIDFIGLVSSFFAVIDRNFCLIWSVRTFHEVLVLIQVYVHIHLSLFVKEGKAQKGTRNLVSTLEDKGSCQLDRIRRPPFLFMTHFVANACNILNHILYTIVGFIQICEYDNYFC